jgi:hypothetical protein
MILVTVEVKVTARAITGRIVSRVEAPSRLRATRGRPLNSWPAAQRHERRQGI